MYACFRLYQVSWTIVIHFYLMCLSDCLIYHIGTLMLCIEAVAYNCVIVTRCSGSGYLQCFDTVGFVIWACRNRS